MLIVLSVCLSLSVSHSITEHIDFATPLQEPAAEPVCNANLPASMHTLDHLGGVANRGGIHYTGESQLREVHARVLYPVPVTHRSDVECIVSERDRLDF